MLQYKFEELSLTGDYNVLCKLFDVPPDTDLIRVPASMGTGIVERIMLAEGLQITNWDICLKKGLQFIKSKQKSTDSRIVTLSYSFSPGQFTVLSEAIGKMIHMDGFVNALFDNGAHDLTFTLSPGEISKCITISIDREWLYKEICQKDIALAKFLGDLISNNNPVFFFEQVTSDEQKILLDFLRYLDTPQRETMFIRGNMMILISLFFKALFQRSPTEINGSNVLHYDKILQAESILMQSLDSTLPSLDELSRKVALSKSTLKRYFKIIFHCSLSEYYLTRKMERARMKIVEQQLPVKEVAYMLGYDTPSSFIRSFRKHFHISPGELQRKTL